MPVDNGSFVLFMLTLLYGSDWSWSGLISGGQLAHGHGSQPERWKGITRGILFCLAGCLVLVTAQPASAQAYALQRAADQGLSTVDADSALQFVSGYIPTLNTSCLLSFLDFAVLQIVNPIAPKTPSGSQLTRDSDKHQLVSRQTDLQVVSRRTLFGLSPAKVMLILRC